MEFLFQVVNLLIFTHDFTAQILHFIEEVVYFHLTLFDFVLFVFVLAREEKERRQVSLKYNQMCQQQNININYNISFFYLFRANIQLALKITQFILELADFHVLFKDLARRDNAFVVLRRQR